MADDRILTTHAGSLPRPSDMVDVLRGHEAGDDGFAERVRQAVHDIVARQLEAGIDLVSDGEMGKANFQMYVEDRLSGFEHLSDAAARDALRHTREDTPVLRDLVDFPDLGARLFPPESGASTLGAVCTGPIGSATREHVEREVDTLRAALAGATERGFISAVSPGQVGFAHADRHYGSRADYLEGIALAMRAEYETIAGAGFTVQLDSPDLAMAGHMLGPSVWREHLELSVEALNVALERVPTQQSRVHLCWGNYGGPHHLDMPLAEILPTVLRANVGALYVEGANGRHEHEWQAFEEVTLPDHMSVVLGVIDVKTNVVEHPRLVADRLKRLAGVIGRERVIAGTDCGFATYAGWSAVDPDVAWLKLGSLVEGAALASDELWP